ncbi:NUDIX hydrolase [Flexibacter flexilis]|nr:CoA pyrophosphatase [Flexibacter flexilis]
MMPLLDTLAQRLQQDLPAQAAHKLMESQARFRQGLSWKPNDKTRQSAVLILLYPHQDSLFFPLTLRHVYKGAHSGQVSLPGGRREEQDRDLVATALRETHEEIGVVPENVQVIGQLTELFVPASNFMIQPFVGYVAERPTFQPDAHEVAQLFETDLQQLTEPFRVKKTLLTVGENIELEAPYFDLHGQIVWGATAMILSELKQILLQSSH